MNDYDFGQNLKMVLLKHNMTQKQLAERLDIDPVTLNRYIKGDRKIPLTLLKEVAAIFNMEPQQLYGTDDSDFLIWHYGMLEGASIDIDEGLQQALEQGRNKTFIYPILRKYYSKQDILDLADSYDQTTKTEKEYWPQEHTTGKPSSQSDTLSEGTPFPVIGSIPSLQISLPESLFTDTTTQERKELIREYFAGLASCIKQYKS